jgi:hypothetical protein
LNVIYKRLKSKLYDISFGAHVILFESSLKAFQLCCSHDIPALLTPVEVDHQSNNATEQNEQYYKAELLGKFLLQRRFVNHC